MDAPFKLLAYAIAAAALIYLFMTFFLPSFIQGTDLQGKMETLLSGAEINLGQTVSESIPLAGQGYYLANRLDTRTRSIAFLCNDSKLCCVKGEKCAKGIEWDERKLVVKQANPLVLSARCREEQLQICKIFAGVKPGQFQVQLDFGNKSQLDLGSGFGYVLEFSVKNTGKLPARALVEINVYKVTNSRGRESSELVSQEKMEPFDLFPGISSSFSKSVSVEKNGDYEVRIIATAEEDATNFSETNIKVSAVNEPTATLCQTTTSQIVNEPDGSCRQEYKCVQCSFGFECRQAWEQELGKVLTEQDRETAFEVIGKENEACATG